jgi:hypothetical protein
MLVPKNRSCDNISFTTDLFREFFGKTEQVEVKVGFNCCDGNTESVILFPDFDNREYKLEFIYPQFSSYQLVKGSFITGGDTEVDLVSSPVLLDETLIFNLINDWLTLNSLPGTVVVDITTVDGVSTLSISITGFTGYDANFFEFTDIDNNTYSVPFIMSEDSGVSLAFSELVLSPELFNKLEFIDGIYSVEVIVKSDEGDIIESSCAFVDCTLKCKLVQHYIDNPTSNLYHLYELIDEAIRCNTCSCQDACDIYRSLYLGLFGVQQTVEYEKLCGCR